jgi:hypothetical protein
MQVKPESGDLGKAYSAEQLALQMKEVDNQLIDIYYNEYAINVKEHSKSSIEDTVNQLAEELGNMNLLMAKKIVPRELIQH